MGLFSGITDFFQDVVQDIGGYATDFVEQVAESNILDINMPGIPGEQLIVGASSLSDTWLAPVSDFLGVDLTGFSELEFGGFGAAGGAVTGQQGTAPRTPTYFQPTSYTGSAPMLMTDSGEMVQTGAFGMIGRGAVALSPLLIGALSKLYARLGGSGASPLAFGRKAWQHISSWAQKNPGVSIVSLLVSLGLTIEEAATFIGWGTQQKKRARGRGINGRDLRTTRRTIRKLTSMHRALGDLCRTAPRPRRK